MGLTNIPAENDIGNAFRRGVSPPGAFTPRAFSAGRARFKSHDSLSLLPLRAPHSTSRAH
ncbi:hypothetical protein [Burkholderia guangdongensis]|uniref:hypothetical protein n=1 Tax=Burkholderia guangdongensis TaxID=1792500 RepID=UPI0015CB97A2|nr:hypothetical protein [Burkholderia guangdongensis]